MLLAVDIGNTNINMGVFKGNKLQRRIRLSTSDNKRLYRGTLKRLFKESPEGAIICSVVPQQTVGLWEMIKGLFPETKIYVVGKDICVPMRNLYRKPQQVGQDRLVGAYAASRIYGRGVIIVDCGTAVTVDVVSRKGSYMGGVIAPGIEMSFIALYEKTSLLPRVKSRLPLGLIGRDSRESMLSGVIIGFAGMVDSLVKKIKKKFKYKLKVIGTGGGIDLILPYTSQIDLIDKDLVLKGLRLIYPFSLSST